MSTTLSPPLFAILSALVEEHLGIRYALEEAALFSDKIAGRVAQAGFHNALDYYYFLRYDSAAGPELDALTDALVVGETYFFRELVPLSAAVEHVLVPAIAKRGRARVWSAGCATGEEPLSLAMLLEERGLGDRCEIVATDLSAKAIGRAREGSYGARAVRALPPNPRAEGLTPSLASVVAASIPWDGSCARAARQLVARIAYRRLNLLDTAGIARLGTFDLVLCRNVLIYFADPTVKRVVTSLTRAMNADGRLLVGAAESLLRFGTALRCEERGGAFLYREDAA